MNCESFVSAVEGLVLMYQRKNPDMCVSVSHTDHGLELICTPREPARKQWVEQMLTEYNEYFKKWSEIVLCDKNRKVMVVNFNNYRGDKRGYGISKCSPTDVFNKDIGMAVAFAHYRNYPIPNFI